MEPLHKLPLQWRFHTLQNYLKIFEKFEFIDGVTVGLNFHKPRVRMYKNVQKLSFREFQRVYTFDL